MSYPDQNQYGDFQFQFGNLSPIVEAALQRKKQQQQQQQQVMGSVLKAVGKLGQVNQQPQDGLNYSDMIANSAAQNAQDPNWQQPAGYAQGGVVPLPENAEGVLGWRTWPDQNSRAEPLPHYAGGGIATSFTDPYPERKSQYAEHLGPLADVSHIAGVISQQNQFKQEQMQKAMQQADKYMQQRESDQIANQVLSQLPAYGVDTGGLEGQGVEGLKGAQQLYGLRQKLDTQANQAEDRANKQYSQGLQDLNNEDKYINHGAPDESPSGPQTTFDESGREWRQGSGGHWFLIPNNQAVGPNSAPPTDRDAQGNQLVTGLPSPQTAAPVQTPAPQGAGTPPSGSVRVVAPNGQSGTIPRANLDAALAAGYRQL